MVIEQKYKVKQNYILRLLIGSFQKVILGFSYRAINDPVLSIVRL